LFNKRSGSDRKNWEAVYYEHIATFAWAGKPGFNKRSGGRLLRSSSDTMVRWFGIEKIYGERLWVYNWPPPLGCVVHRRRNDAP